MVMDCGRNGDDRKIHGGITMEVILLACTIGMIGEILFWYFERVK